MASEGGRTMRYSGVRDDNSDKPNATTVTGDGGAVQGVTIEIDQQGRKTVVTGKA